MEVVGIAEDVFGLNYVAADSIPNPKAASFAR
jgi:hypothetical protein